MQKNDIIKAYGTDYKGMTKRLLDYCKITEDISKKSENKTKDKIKIGIKPNLVSPAPADMGATTHPEIVEGIIEYLKENGYKDIILMEGSWVGSDTEESFKELGYDKITEKYGVPFFDMKKDTPVQKITMSKDIPVLNICAKVFEMDYLINVPVLKGHCQTKVSCALKNLKGIIPDSEKRRFHKLGLHEPIALLNTAVNTDLIVTDHICGDPSFEDGGNPCVRNCIMVSKDPVLTDVYACRLLGYETGEVQYIGLSEKYGVGTADLSKMNLVTIEGIEAEELPYANKVMELSYRVNQLDSCSTCYSYLIDVLERLKKEGLLDHLDSKLCIGQGYRDEESLNGLCLEKMIGIGSCTKRLPNHIKGCPPDADTIYEKLKQYIENAKQFNK